MQENMVCLLLLYGTPAKDARWTISDLQTIEVLHGDIEPEIVYRFQDIMIIKKLLYAIEKRLEKILTACFQEL